MSVTYPDLENKFPDEIDNIERFSDPTITDIPIINQYNAYYLAGDLESATALLDNNPSLKKMIVNADTLNMLRDMTISTQRYYMNDVQQYLQDIVKYRGVYNPNAKYTKYDMVIYDTGTATQAYLCVNRNTPIGTLPTNTTYFTMQTLRGEQGVSGTGLSYRGVWNSSTQYYKDDCVANDNKLWSANVNSLNSVPSIDNSDWTLIIDIYKQAVLSSAQPSNQASGDIWYQII